MRKLKNNKAYAVLSLSLHMAGALFLILFAFFILTPYVNIFINGI